MASNSVSYDQCKHNRVRHSPDGFNIIEECHECFSAWMIQGVTGEVIKLAPTWMERVIANEKRLNKERS